MKYIYVIMASYLGYYPKCSQDRSAKFVRAVDSFIKNTYEFKKLIIVADGCKETEAIYQEKYKFNNDVVLIKLEKQVAFSGNVRNAGLKYVKEQGTPEDIICYLDSDDRFGENHLKKIVEGFGENDFIIYDTHRISPNGWYISKVAIKACNIGTSSFAHKAGLAVSWTDGYGHDWRIINEMSKKYKYSEIALPEYYIHHTPSSDC